VLKETKQFSLLEINLLTGRKNQIRVHMADKGHPIVGDRKYGKTKDGYRRLALHSKSISFKHPTSGEQMTFETKVPNYFNKLIDNIQERGYGVTHLKKGVGVRLEKLRFGVIHGKVGPALKHSA
jgi:hypothetical protein